MAEVVILSAVEALEAWLFKMAGRRDDSYAKLCSLVFGMADIDGEASKEKLHGVLLGMADFWEDNKEKLYCLLVLVACRRESQRPTMNKEEQCSLLEEMTDLWEDNLNKEKLHSLVAELEDLWCQESNKRRLYKKKLYGLLVEIAGLWKHSKGKLNKVKVHGWLAEKADLWEHKQLLRTIRGVALRKEEEEASDSQNLICEMVKEVKNNLTFILDFLTDNRFQYLISDVVEMAHDAQILIQVRDSDPLMLFLEIFNSDYRFVNRDTLGFSKMVNFIQNGLRETKESILQFGVESLQNFGGLEQGAKVVGLEEDIHLLLHNEDIGTTTFIRGMVGIGKTTLARQLYNHKDVRLEFKCRAWASLSRELSRKELLMDLIRQVSNDTIEFKRYDVSSSLEKMDNKSLKQVLHQCLQGMRYFIVLDGVLDNTTYLKYVMKALPKGKGSRLLFTTRSVDIQCKHPHDYNHKMKFMDEDNSWKFLLKTILLENSDLKFPKPLEKMAKQMLKKHCNGLPLAIQEVGKQWASKVGSGSEWEKVVESTSLGATLAALESTYHKLDPQVKSLFLYLGFFQEGTVIRTTKLLQLWNTARVVDDKQFRHCLSRLSKESIIEVKDMTKTNDGIKTFHSNVVFRSLSITKAEDEISFEILKKDGNNRLRQEPHHRVICCSRKKFNYSTNQDKHLVSLFFHGGGYFNTSPSYWKHFEQLKTLDIEDFGLKILPDAVGTLIELRYLGLRNNYIQELPHSLGRLKNLEVLDVALNFTVNVPDIIWGMYSLRHLFMSDISSQNPLTIDALKNLETLTYISVDNWLYALWGLSMMTSLSKLGIEEVDENTDVSKLFASLAELENLSYLILRGFRYKSMPCLDELGILHRLTRLKLDGFLTMLPNASDFPPNINYLCMVNSCLDEDPMPILEKLSKLEYLKLENAYTGQQMVISLNGFGNLRNLVIVELWHLKNIEVQKSAMENLERLEINGCPYLESLSAMENLERLEISNCPYLESFPTKTSLKEPELERRHKKEPESWVEGILELEMHERSMRKLTVMKVMQEDVGVLMFSQVKKTKAES